MIINTESKQLIMEFEKIRKGTVFTFENKTYLRCEQETAVDLSTGDIIRPVDWNICCIYPRASLQLGT